MPVIAHAGHWLVNVILLVPTAGFLVWLIVITIKNRGKPDPPAPGGSDGH